MLPLAAVAYLGFPTTSYQLQALTIPLFGAGSVAASLATKAALAALLAGAWFLPAFRPPTGAAPAPAPASKWAPLRLALLAALTAFQGYYYSVGASAVELGRLEMSYLQAGWSGRPYDRSALGEEFFQGRVWSRRYLKGTQAVDVLVTSTGGDRHRAHPPAYCLTGDGWVVVSERRIERPLGDGRTVPMTRMRLRKDGREMDFSFWFTDGADARGTYRDMLAEDTVRRLAGRRTDWFLFRVMTESGEPSLDGFLGDFRAAVERTP
jgi:EpsI family protein